MTTDVLVTGCRYLAALAVDDVAGGRERLQGVVLDDDGRLIDIALRIGGALGEDEGVAVPLDCERCRADEVGVFVEAVREGLVVLPGDVGHDVFSLRLFECLAGDAYGEREYGVPARMMRGKSLML